MEYKREKAENAGDFLPVLVGGVKLRKKWEWGKKIYHKWSDEL